MIIINICELSNDELILTYSSCIRELKSRKLIRTNNVIGELGEYLTISYYNKTPGLPKLQAAPIGTQNIDALSRNGERYSIKSSSTNTTGVFFGLNPKGSEDEEKQKFEYVVLCRFDDNCSLKSIYELSWGKFLIHKKWHSRMNAWNLCFSQKLLADCRTIYICEE